MNYYQKSKKFIKRGADSLNNKLENESVKKIKRVTIIIFATLLILDIVFVFPGISFPTISRVMLFSSPKYLFIIWLWGIATSNIFFPRKIKNTVKVKFIGLLFLIAITVPLYFVGDMISKQSDELSFIDRSTASTSMFTEIICYNEDVLKVDCSNDATPCTSVRIDINTGTKTMLLVAGMLFGYFLWPQVEKKVDKPGDISA